MSVVVLRCQNLCYLPTVGEGLSYERFRKEVGGIHSAATVNELDQSKFHLASYPEQPVLMTYIGVRFLRLHEIH